MSGETVVVRETAIEVVETDEGQAELLEIGIPGDPGLGAAIYIHTQTSASGQWTINHNLGFNPDIALADDGGNVIDAQVLHASDNQTIVYFNQPTAGTARCT